MASFALAAWFEGGRNKIMVFNSWTFGLFFLVFLGPYFCLRRKVAARNSLLIFASYLFYGWWDCRFLILVALSTTVDYIAALGASGAPILKSDVSKALVLLSAVTFAVVAVSGLDAFFLVRLVAFAIIVLGLATLSIETLARGQGRRRAYLALSLLTNLGILGFFKYCNFFAANAEALLSHLGLALPHFALNIILPVGLSFYTFQALSRTIDSYKGRFQPARSLINYAAFHAFFPQLVAGPIERADHLMPQFESPRSMSLEHWQKGLWLFLWGLFLKVVIADNLSPLAGAVFNAPLGQSGGASVAGVLAFTFQIYGDFCGYSNMAVGLACVLGFDLMRNFNLPYFARSPQEFWRRWHISLSLWLRDYLYIPLGGSRGSALFTSRNLLLTMILGGLWHGAAWNFIIWGFWHGLAQVAFRAFKIDAVLKSIPASSIGGICIHLAAWLATFILVAIGWVFFRALNLADALTILLNCLRFDGYSVAQFQTLAFYLTPLVIVELWQYFSPQKFSLPFLLRYSAQLCLILGLMLLPAEGGKQFIYFDF